MVFKADLSDHVPDGLGLVGVEKGGCGDGIKADLSDHVPDGLGLVGVEKGGGGNGI